MQKTKQILDRVEKVLCISIVAILVAMTLSTSLQVITRYALAVPLPWTEELSRRLMSWVAFLATPVAYRKGGQIGVDFLLNRLPLKIQRYGAMLIECCVIGFALFIIVQGIVLVSKSMNQMSSVIGISMGYIYLSIPLCGILITIFGIEKLSERIVNRES